MDEQLLTSLCSICYIDPPKYTCPRCFAQTCSLKCSKRHKIWSSCNGIRDPTIYKPMSQLATPAGIDHDYNFLHSIELGIDRSEKVLIEDLGLLSREELRTSRSSECQETWKKKSNPKNERPGEVCIRKVIQDNNIQVVKAPNGMRRNKENTTTWSRKRKIIYWQVEWLRGIPSERLLYRISGSRPIGDQYNMICEEELRMKMTDEERREDRKRKAQLLEFRVAKKQKLDLDNCLNSITALLQDPETKAWHISQNMGDHQRNNIGDTLWKPAIKTPHFYILRPLTPASFPKVIAEIDPRKSLTEILANRCILEFPTIYVLDQGYSQLPTNFMLEKEYNELTNSMSSEKNSETDRDKNIDEQSDYFSDTSDDSCDSSSSSDSSRHEGEIKNTGI